MSDENKSISITIDADTQWLIKAAAALNGVTVEKFCHTAIKEKAEKTVYPDGRNATFNEERLRTLAESRERIFNGRILPGNSADFIREAREARGRQLGKGSDC